MLTTPAVVMRLIEVLTPEARKSVIALSRTEERRPFSPTTKPRGENRPSSPLVNHRAPSGPAVMLPGPLMLGLVKLVTTPDDVMRSIELSPPEKEIDPVRSEGIPPLVNHRLPSGPVVIPP